NSTRTTTSDPLTADPAAADPAAACSAGVAPPPAQRIPVDRTHHGDTVIDEYAWLADKKNPQTIEFLEAQNAYTEELTAGQAELRETIFGEIKARTQETDLSVPSRKGDWWYYTRTQEGRQYPVFCRRAVRPDDAVPPMTEDGQHVPLHANELGGDGKFLGPGTIAVSPDGRLLAYSTDYEGDKRFTLRVK